MTDLKKLFGIDGEEPLIDPDSIRNRIQVAHMLRNAVATGLQDIRMQLDPSSALLLAGDIEFSCHVHPFGVPPDALPPQEPDPET